MKARWVIARKEIGGVFRERTILLAVVIQVFVAGFSSFLVVGLSALVDPEALPSAIPSTVAVSGNEALAGHFREEGMGVYRIQGRLPNASEAVDAFQKGLVQAAVLATDGEDPADPVRTTVYLPDGDFRSTLTLVQVKDALESYERALRDARGDRLDREPVVLAADVKAGSFGFVYSLLIPLLVFLPVVLAGALTADSLTEEVQRGTLPLLLASPATAADVVEGKLVANAALAPLLAAAWFGLLALNDLTVPLAGALMILVLATAVAFLMGTLACAIALFTRDRNKAHVFYALAMFLLLGASLALPVSPVNAVALLAAGSTSAGAVGVVVGAVLAAAGAWIAIRVGLRRLGPRLAAGGA